MILNINKWLDISCNKKPNKLVEFLIDNRYLIIKKAKTYE
jgi:phage antirepressor YoqD-like protein